MRAEVINPSLARRTALRLDRRLYFLLDFAVVSFIFVVTSLVTWAPVVSWRDPAATVPVVALLVASIALKAAVIRSEADPVRRLAKLHIGILLVYALMASYLVLSRGYYSRSFLLLSLFLVMVWYVIDALFVSIKIENPLVAVPSPMIDRLRAVSNVSVEPLESPMLSRKVSGLLVDLHENLAPEWLKFVAACAAAGIPVFHAAAVFEAVTGRVALSHLSEGMVVEFAGGRKAYRFVKRAFDVLVVLVFLPLLLPVALVIAALIKLDSPGPALYWQDRVGERGVPFRMVKFRSMRVDAENDGAMFAREGDPRITRVGRILRRYRLDELPQCWNVLLGQMSLIGPRPEQVDFAAMFEKEIPYYSWRHFVKPGITGWAQVQHGYAAGVESTRTKTEYDLYYIKHLSFWLDLSILIRTIGTVLTGNGAR